MFLNSAWHFITFAQLYFINVNLLHLHRAYSGLLAICENFYEQPWGGSLRVGRSQRFISALQIMSLISGGGLQLAPWAVCSWVWSGWMRISSYMSEAMVLSQKTEVCPLWVGNESLPQVEGFKYLGIPFTSERRVEWQIDKQLAVEGAVMWTLHQCVVEKRDMSMKVKLS